MTDLMKKSEVAKAFRVTTRTIENYRKNGTLPCPIVISNRPMWPASVIRAMVERTGSTPA
jgi:predicted site-specific integrase-resolvase